MPRVAKGDTRGRVLRVLRRRGCQGAKGAKGAKVLTLRHEYLIHLLCRISGFESRFGTIFGVASRVKDKAVRMTFCILLESSL